MRMNKEDTAFTAMNEADHFHNVQCAHLRSNLFIYSPDARAACLFTYPHNRLICNIYKMNTPDNCYSDFLNCNLDKSMDGIICIIKTILKSTS